MKDYEYDFLKLGILEAHHIDYIEILAKKRLLAFYLISGATYQFIHADHALLLRALLLKKSITYYANQAFSMHLQHNTIYDHPKNQFTLIEGWDTNFRPDTNSRIIPDAGLQIVTVRQLENGTKVCSVVETEKEYNQLLATKANLNFYVIPNFAELKLKPYIKETEITDFEIEEKQSKYSLAQLITKFCCCRCEEKKPPSMLKENLLDQKSEHSPASVKMDN